MRTDAWIILMGIHTHSEEHVMSPRHASHRLTGPMALALVALCATQAFGQAGHISGQVKDADTGKPIKGVTVVAENAEAIPSSFTSASDDKGRFSMIGLRSGLWVFTASFPGYQPERGAARVQTMGPSGTLFFALRKQPEPYVSPLAGVDPKVLLRDLAEAEELAARGQWDEALAAYDAIKTKLPALTLVELEIGRLYRAKKDFAKATASFQKVLEEDPQSQQARVELATTEIEAGELDAAERELAAAAELPGESRDVYFMLGEVKLAKAQPGEAAAYYRKAVGVDPLFAKGYLRLGVAAARQDDSQRAKLEWEKVIAIDPDAPEAAEARTLLAQLNASSPPR